MIVFRSLNRAVLAVVTVVAGMMMLPAPAAAAPEWFFGDLNGDGISDRARLHSFGVLDCGVTVGFGTGTGTYGPGVLHRFAPPPHSFEGECPHHGTIVDLGGDGVPEMVLAWHWGNPDYDLLVLRDYRPVATVWSPMYQPLGIGSGPDFNGDGLPDVYQWTEQGAGFITLLNTRSGQLVPGPSIGQTVRGGFSFADVDRNGRADVLIPFDDPGTGVLILRDNDTTVVLHEDGGGWDAVFVDANGDDLPDVRTTGGDRVVTTFINRNHGRFVAAPYPVADRFAVTPGVPQVLDVLANDGVTTAVKLTIATRPKYGTATVGPDKKIHYVRTATAHTQPDKIVYRVTEKGGLTDTTTVTVNVTG